MRISMKKRLLLFVVCSLSYKGYGTDNQESTSFKKLFMDKVAIPLYMQYDRIKDEGPTKTDLFVLGLGVGALYGLKKTADHYHLFAFDLDKSSKVLNQDWHLIKEHKGKIAFGAAGLCVLALVVKKGLEINHSKQLL